MRCAHELLRQNLVHVIASDAHSSENRAPVLSAAMEAVADVLKSNVLAKALFSDNPRRIVEGRDIAPLARITSDSLRMSFSRKIKAFLGE